MINILASFNCFNFRNLFENDANDISEMVNMIKRSFVKKLQILHSLDHQILFKFSQLGVNTIVKELQIVF